MQNVVEAKAIVKNFLGKTIIHFYESAVDGTPCVEYRMAGRIETATVENMAARIERYKKTMQISG